LAVLFLYEYNLLFGTGGKDLLMNGSFNE